MASSSSTPKSPCATCINKAAGICRCEGCAQLFCPKHLNEHRDLLHHQLDEIFTQHDTLQQTIHGNNNTQHPILKQIDQWEHDSIIKIQQVAEQTRQQVTKLTITQTTSKELHDLAEELQKARVNNDFIETDLEMWTKMLEKLKDDIHIYNPSISIQEDKTQTLVNKISVSKVAALPRAKQNEKFGETYGDIRIENDGCSAIQCGRMDNHSCVRGMREYSSGKHFIRFLFTKKDYGATLGSILFQNQCLFGEKQPLT